ncbi:gag-pol polyprotein [Tanacetum coccineum]
MSDLRLSCSRSFSSWEKVFLSVLVNESGKGKILCQSAAILRTYIPLNNEQNEPTQGDINKTSNELTQAIRNEFEELYVSANEELYPGCDYVTRLHFMAKLTYFKVKGHRSKILGSVRLCNTFLVMKDSKQQGEERMTWHATGKCTEPGKMQHPVDGRAWKNFDTKYLDFIKEPRNVRLGLAVDSSYSIIRAPNV